MNRNSVLLYLLLATLVVVSCNNNVRTVKLNDDAHDFEKERTYKYKREWLEFKHAEEIKEQVEVYVTENNDTLYYQNKLYRNNVIDNPNSKYYELSFERTENSINKGSITLHSYLDDRIESPLQEKSLELYLVQTKSDDSIDVVTFKSKNSNTVDFYYKNRSDTLVGLLIEQRYIDTIVGGESMIRIVESMFPIDNKGYTDNRFIEAFDLK